MKISPVPRLSRSKSFFGIHFDFHAGHRDENIGGRPFTRTLKELLKRTQPDYVQCDCKGHPGICSYPTEVGTSSAGLVGDPLKVWRRVTAEAGVALYMHYSGVADRAAISAHPSWARIDEKGKKDPANTSTFGKYSDGLFIPQLEELRKIYSVDGFWVDGDCWATSQDYGKKVLAAFRQQTGITDIPRKLGDPHFFKFTEFCREGFRNYLRHYVDEIHHRCPGVEVASNWAFSSFMPEPVSADVDFLSGDYTLSDSVNSARLEARCLMHQGKPWDLMAWGFSGLWEDNCRSSKTAEQLKREAAVVLSLGGGFQMYFKQRRDASICEHDIEVIEAISKFCRERQEWCHQAKSIPQVALLYSSASYYRASRRLFAPWDGELTALQGALKALLENQYAVDILSEHHLEKTMDEYPLIVVPEWNFLDRAFRRRLVDYAKRGGRLFIMGARTLPMFAQQLGIRVLGETVEKNRWVSINGRMAGIKGWGTPIRPLAGTRVIAEGHSKNDFAAPAEPVAVSRRIGKGKIVGLNLDFGARFRDHRTAQARELIRKLVETAWSNPKVRVTGSSLIDVTLMQKNERILIHLVNTSGPHDHKANFTFDEITPLGPLEIAIDLPTRPAAIYQQPEGEPLPFQWKSGTATMQLPRLAIHAILEISPASRKRR